jgi:Tol biopolymer transport system component
VIGFVIRRDRTDQPSSFAGATFTQLTSRAGAEFFPSIAPDGESFVFAAGGDIFFQRVGGENPINLMKDDDPNTIDTQPVFSPDGRLIAFRSNRNGGGIFVMGATGESMKRLTNSGANPSWSPDQKEIVYSTESVGTNPLNRGVGARLWVVNVATGATRQLTEMDAVQPNWSPHGQRIAFWAIPEGGSQRDIWTVPAEGGKPVQITNDAAVDWNPVWSPDGRYIYFSSDRAGTMNLWRILVDETSGEPGRTPEPLTTPATIAAHMSFSRDGKRMLYADVKNLANVSKIEFDPAKEVVKGNPIPITQGSKLFTGARPSPDGQWLTFSSAVQEDIYISKADGTGLRNLTSDDFRDRSPRWAPDGRTILFYSDRSGGRYQIWSINIDGSGLKQITDSATNVLFPLISPDGSRLIFSDYEKTSFMMRTDKAWKDQSVVALPAIDNFGAYLIPSSWSADGKWAAGTLRRPGSGPIPGIYIYSPESNGYRQLTSYGGNPLWLNDSRRILFSNGPKLGIVDTETKTVHDVEGVAGATGISRDNRWLYFQQNSVESDIWMLKQAGSRED